MKENRIRRRASMGEIIVFGILLLIVLIIGIIVLTYVISHWKELLAMVVVIFVLGVIGKLFIF